MVVAADARLRSEQWVEPAGVVDVGLRDGVDGAFRGVSGGVVG
jgi:hypothetical protein